MRIGIVSDVHCRHDALALAIRRMGAIDRLVCAGDVIDQSRFCSRTVALLQALGAETVLGNHDLAFLSGKGPRDGIEAVTGAWLAGRPEELRLDLGGLRVRVVHATPWAGDFAYVTPTHPRFPGFEEEGADVLIYGHTHVPVVQRLGGTLVINPGSVGEGRPEPHGFVRSCAVLDAASGEARIIDLD